MSNVGGIALASSVGGDFEVAFSVAPNDGGWHALLAITALADALPRDSPVDSEALRRGFTRYHGGGGLGPPMLPRRLEAASSLDPRRRLPVLVLVLDFAPDGEQHGARIGRARPGGGRRLSFAQADRLIDSRMSDGAGTELRHAADLAAALLAARRRRGSLAVDEPRVGLATSEEGRLLPPGAGRGHRSARLLAEFEIAAGAAVGRLAAGWGLPLAGRLRPAGRGDPRRDRPRGRAPGRPPAPQREGQGSIGAAARAGAMSPRAAAGLPSPPGRAAVPAPQGGGRPELARAAFDAFNRADWPAALALMCEDVVWEDGLGGGRRQGRAAVGRHWAWLAARFALRVEILGLEAGPQGALRVEAHLLIHDTAGKLLAHQDMLYILRFRGERIAGLERGGEGRGGG